MADYGNHDPNERCYYCSKQATRRCYAQLETLGIEPCCRPICDDHATVTGECVNPLAEEYQEVTDGR